MSLTQTEINALKAPFPLEVHSIREGNKVRGGKGIQWFVYVDKTEVEKRLNEVFPGEWGSTVPVLYPTQSGFAATIGITIRGITRGNTGEDSNGMEKAKGATTDAFRRAANEWGISMYIYDMDFSIYTDSYPDKDYDTANARKKEAFDKFASWYKRTFGNATSQPLPASPANAPAANVSEVAKAQENAKTGQSGNDPLNIRKTDNVNEFWNLFWKVANPLFKAAGYEDKHKQNSVNMILAALDQQDNKPNPTARELLTAISAHLEAKQQPETEVVF